MKTNLRNSQIFLRLLIGFLVVGFVISFLWDSFGVFKDSLGSVRYSIAAYKLNNNEKMRLSFGIVYDYALFVKDNTSPNSKILIPPQGSPWAMTGNVLFFRYFLYPRQLVNGGEKEAGLDIAKEHIDYILIDWGESDISQYGYTNGWPKFRVDAKKIILVKEFKNNETVLEEKNGSYDPKDPIYIRRWGLIKIN